MPARDLDASADAGGSVRSGLSPLERQQQDLARPESATFWHRVRFELVVNEARSIGARSILDIGAGSGLLGDHLASSGHGLSYAFDELSPALDAGLTARFGSDARWGDDDAIEPDTVCAMLDVVEHIEHDEQALATWRRRMHPGTRLVVTVPALQWAFSQWDVDLGHFRRYSRRRLRDVLGSAGFRVIESAYIFPELLPIVAKRKFLPGRDGEVDMPELNARVAGVAHAISSTTARLRRIWPAGTSVYAVAEVPR